MILGSLEILEGVAPLGLNVEGGPAAPDQDRARKAVDLWLERRASRGEQVQGLVWRGRLRDLRNDRAGARADLKKAVNLDPDDFDARLRLALVVLEVAPQEAIEHFRILLRQRPENRLARFSLAYSLHGLGHLEEARRLLDDLLFANPNDVPALIERGNVAVDTQQYTDAERWLRRAVEVAPANPRGHFCLAGCLQLEGKTEEAFHHQEAFKQRETEEKRGRDKLIQDFSATTNRNRQHGNERQKLEPRE